MESDGDLIGMTTMKTTSFYHDVCEHMCVYTLVCFTWLFVHVECIYSRGGSNIHMGVFTISLHFI